MTAPGRAALRRRADAASVASMGRRRLGRVLAGLVVAGALVGGAATASAAPVLDADGARTRPIDERTQHPLCRFGRIPEIARDGRCTHRFGPRVAATAHPGTVDLAEQAVMDQQRHLNTLFEGYGIAPLEVDGDSGAVTEQRLCAFRLIAGLPVTTDDMEPGSDEEGALFAAEELPLPDWPVTAGRCWHRGSPARRRSRAGGTCSR